MTPMQDWRARLAERGFAGARMVPPMYGAAVLRDLGEPAASESALRELLGRSPDHEGALRALVRLLEETGRDGEAASARRRLLIRRCGELGIPEAQQDAAIAYLEAAETGAAPPERADGAYTAALFNQYAEHFDAKLRGNLAYRGPEHVLDAVRDALDGRRELDVLDLGCGTGLAGALLRPLARRLEGMDLSPGMLERARERGVYDALHTGDVLALLDASSARYSLVTAVDVLNYFGALEPLFERVARRLAAGGLFAFTVEKGTEPGFQLKATRRYVHHLDYVRGCARAVGLAPVVEREAVLRTEHDAPVFGHVVVLRA